jgi:hypothetical protein
MAAKNKQEQIEEVQLDVELLAWKRIKEALEADEYNDEAKLAKDTVSVLAKKRQTDGARDQLRFMMLSSVGTDAQRRRYVESQVPDVKRFLGPEPSGAK